MLTVLKRDVKQSFFIFYLLLYHLNLHVCDPRVVSNLSHDSCGGDLLTAYRVNLYIVSDDVRQRGGLQQVQGDVPTLKHIIHQCNLDPPKTRLQGYMYIVIFLFLLKT